MTIITGYAAIDYARKNDRLLAKYQDPTEGVRYGLEIDEAEEIAREDPSLIYIDTQGVQDRPADPRDFRRSPYGA